MLSHDWTSKLTWFTCELWCATLKKPMNKCRSIYIPMFDNTLTWLKRVAFDLHVSFDTWLQINLWTNVSPYIEASTLNWAVLCMYIVLKKGVKTHLEEVKELLNRFHHEIEYYIYASLTYSTTHFKLDTHVHHTRMFSIDFFKPHIQTHEVISCENANVQK